MYRHKNLLAADGASGGEIDYATGIDSSIRARELPRQALQQPEFCLRKGYNTRHPNQAREWNSKMFKAMWWSGSRAKFHGVTWHGSESQRLKDLVTPNYHLNVDNAFATAHPFADWINSLTGTVTVAAHSLGNMVVSSAIHDWSAPVANFYMVDSAVAIEAFDGGSLSDPLMAHEDWFRVNASVDENYQIGSGRVNGIKTQTLVNSMDARL